ncbi:haloacid dehalogenase superfamily, subfamily IA, variant 1 with third motif having Dx(3-4)D or Dx(3-4)E [Paenibacillus polysaccharolyticus]|uniref:Haloacid dehalogenase superfamily, subfamily IA, variant 1 with third motif having Dx(3-4)D or Dx(3-4)E n=1 Tax=Paenibacillus polysaccharolyticus TaxID=582692 RepID=A0A1G5K9S1_9BACL|nr:HAD-IA family hydrolase [Paenibacillus polysaccharolyticus]SCY96689.1 haloacid dehalogenase superfamily, subfamily IA, variant 1 with third motif having Dx(3-4)D or Dx(3-4)E [Paenibacillus polysaccharolyticus]
MIKKIKDKMFYYVVERNPHILQEYQQYRWRNDKFHEENRLKSWFYLLDLNFKHRILKIPHRLESPPIQQSKLPYLDGAESESHYRPLAHHFAYELLMYDVISFDIFDTLLLRPFDDPKKLFMLLGEKHDYVDFMTIRVKAEQEARENANHKKGNREVNIYDIYEIIERNTGIDKEYGIQVELDVELELCYANPYMKRVFEILKSQGKRMIATSDMYLPENMIRQLLEKCDYNGFEDVFVSCDYNCSKRDTYLFRIVKNKIGANTRVVHIGDNYIPDVVSAQQVGFDAKYYENVNEVGGKYRADGMSELVSSAYSGIVNAHLHNGLKKYSPHYEYGFTYGGLYVFGYCNWIYNQAKKKNVEKVLFLSRDGYIYHQVFRYFFNDMPSEYALWSRIANTKYTAEKNKDDFLTRMVRQKANTTFDITISSLLDSFKLSILESKLEEFGLKKSEIVNNGNVKQIENLIVKYWGDILESVEHDLEELKNYFEYLIAGHQNVAIVDVGWIGSGARGIKYLIEDKWKLGCKVSSFVAASTHYNHSAIINQLMSEETDVYIFSRMKNRNLYDFHLHTNNKTNNIYFELFTQACSPSFSGINANETDGLKFEFDVPEVENYEVIEQIHEGIMDFAKIYGETFNKFKYVYNISGYDAYLPFRMITKDLKFIKKFYRGFSFSRFVGADTENQRTENLGEILDKSNL